MANSTEEQKKAQEEQERVAKEATKQADKDNEQLLAAGGNADITAGGQKRMEIVRATAPVPDTVSNILEEGHGYYVLGKLVDPNGKPIEG